MAVNQNMRIHKYRNLGQRDELLMIINKFASWASWECLSHVKVHENSMPHHLIPSTENFWPATGNVTLMLPKIGMATGRKIITMMSPRRFVVLPRAQPSRWLTLEIKINYNGRMRNGHLSGQSIQRINKFYIFNWNFIYLASSIFRIIAYVASGSMQWIFVVFLCVPLVRSEKPKRNVFEWSVPPILCKHRNRHRVLCERICWWIWWWKWKHVIVGGGDGIDDNWRRR